jgi:hypothetical protein
MSNIMTLEEIEALRSVNDMAELYGWRIPIIWTPALVKHMFYQQYNREMSDQEWDIFSSGDCWNNGLIMAGAVNENEAIRIGMQDALDDAIDPWAADNIDNIYFINDETNMQEVFDSIADDIFGEG